MSTTAESFRQIEPAIRRRPNGDYLATSKPGSPLSIGAIGGSETEARAMFYKEREAWAALSEAPPRQNPD